MKKSEYTFWIFLADILKGLIMISLWPFALIFMFIRSRMKD